MLNDMDKIPPSFIDDSKLVKLTTAEFVGKMKSARFPLKLENLDLSDVDFLYASNTVEMDFEGWEIINVIFSRFDPKYRGKKHLYGLSFIGAKMKRVGFAQAFLDRCNFDWEKEKQNDKSEKKKNDKDDEYANLEKVDFFYSEFSYCRFRGCKMKMVDFRYAKVSDCSMNEIDVTFGDFYCCDFKGCTAFVESNFTKCSFTNAVFEHQVIRFGSIHGILQDDINDYRKIIFGQNWLHYNPCGTRKSDLEKKELGLLEKEIGEEAIEMYKQFSGIYAGKGLHKDSNAAYKRMKKRELRKSWKNAKVSVLGLLLFLCFLEFLFFKFADCGYINCKVVFSCLGLFALYILYDSFKDYIKKALRYIWLKFKDICGVVSGLFTFLMGYGYKWVNVIIVYAILILIGAVGYYCCYSGGNCSWQDALNRSFYNIIAPNNCIDSKGCCGLLEGIHHLLGVLLIGYLGFIFANKMRNNL